MPLSQLNTFEFHSTIAYKNKRVLFYLNYSMHYLRKTHIFRVIKEISF